MRHARRVGAGARAPPSAIRSQHRSGARGATRGARGRRARISRATSSTAHSPTLRRTRPRRGARKSGGRCPGRSSRRSRRWRCCAGSSRGAGPHPVRRDRDPRPGAGAVSSRRGAGARARFQHFSLSATDEEWEVVRANAARRRVSMARYLVELGLAGARAEAAGPPPVLTPGGQRGVEEAMRVLASLADGGADTRTLIEEMHHRVAVLVEASSSRGSSTRPRRFASCSRSRSACEAAGRGCGSSGAGTPPRPRRRRARARRPDKGSWPRVSSSSVSSQSRVSRTASSCARTTRRSPKTSASSETDFGADSVRSSPGRCWRSPSRIRPRRKRV